MRWSRYAPVPIAWMNLLLQKYRIIGKKGEGTFSEVLKCQNINDGSYVACKKMKQTYDTADQINNLREIQAMRKLNPHPNILELLEVIFDKKSGILVLVCELMDMNIYELIRGKRHYLPAAKVKFYMYQLIKSMDHMHRHGIFHRDVKPENILIKDDLLKLADFGSCRSVFSKQPYTEYISTRWYRAPECLLTDGYYTYKMDMWSVGCVFFEILSLHPLFPGSNEVDQIAKIHDIMGTPEPEVLNKLKRSRGMNFNFPPKKGTGIERMLPHASGEAVDLIYQMCTYDPDIRLSAKQCLRHSYFKDLRDADKRAMAQLRQQQKKAVEKIELNPPEVLEEEQRLKLIELPSEESSPKLNGPTEITMYPSIKAKSIPSSNQPFKELKRRKHHRMTEGNGMHRHMNLLPRVSVPPMYNPTFGSSSFSTSFSKFYGPQSTSLLPTIGSYKPHKRTTGTASYLTATIASAVKAAAKPKGMYGAYAFPSLDRRY